MEDKLQDYGGVTSVGVAYEPHIVIPQKRRVFYPILKRAMDIVLSLFALIVLAIPMLIIAVCIKIDSPGPVVFKQKRAGKNGVPFMMFKFRSMCVDAEEKLVEMEAFKDHSPIDIKLRLKDDPRITKFGQILRKTSLDETLQFFNTLLGSMSLVGPRPLAMIEHEAMNDYQQQRCLVKPGITCFWQVSGRSNLTEMERVELDFRYIREQSITTDIMLLFKTIPALIAKRGAY